MKVTLQVSGREMTFSEQELTAIVEKHFSDEATKKVTTVKVSQKPTEGKWFEVKPLAIDQTLFKEKREDESQEKMRQLILEAFEELKNNPEKYGKNFKTMMPKNTGRQKTIAELKEKACDLGDRMANWVEQSLEWAQRIANGESWEDLCNKPDTANWYRAVTWKNGYVRLVGGSVRDSIGDPASVVSYYVCSVSNFIISPVPLVVLYEK